MSRLSTNDFTVLYAQAFGLSKMQMGHALWKADHPGPEIVPGIGSIGFVYRGKWVEIAKLDDPEIQRHIQKSPIMADEPLKSSNIQSKKFGLEGSFIVGPAVNVGDGINYSSFKEFGAVLTLSEHGESKDASNVLYFKKTMCQNYRKWYNKARRENHFDVDLDQIILVTGCDYGTHWANAVIKASEIETDVEIKVGAAGFANGRFSAAIKDSGSGIHMKNWGPIKRLFITDAMHICDPLEPPEYDMDTRTSFERDSGDEEDHDGDSGSPSNGSRTSSSFRQLCSSFLSSKESRSGSSSSGSSKSSPSSSSSKGNTRSTRTNSIVEPFDSTDDLCIPSSSRRQKPIIDVDILEEISDPLSALLLYMLMNSDAELAVAHHSDLSSLSLPESRTIEEFIANLYRMKPSIKVENSMAWISPSEDFQIIDRSGSVNKSQVLNSTAEEIISAKDTLNLLNIATEDDKNITQSSPSDLRSSLSSESFQIQPQTMTRNPSQSESHDCTVYHHDHNREHQANIIIGTPEESLVYLEESTTVEIDPDIGSLSGNLPPDVTNDLLVSETTNGVRHSLPVAEAASPAVAAPPSADTVIPNNSDDYIDHIEKKDKTLTLLKTYIKHRTRLNPPSKPHHCTYMKTHKSTCGKSFETMDEALVHVESHLKNVTKICRLW
ncbi:hypothetical protein M422DRAFT_242515 [Sphaerobolus stellatus SS14]|nr:hypothetical protein M422DRAFT_242515 [Sphaerobolus stellatus SS14]